MGVGSLWNETVPEGRREARGCLLRPRPALSLVGCVTWQSSLAHAGPARQRWVPDTPTNTVVSLQPSLGACVVELEFPSHWFSPGSTRAELAYTLEPAAGGPRGCGDGGEDAGEQALPVGSVELRPADPPQYQEVPLDEAVTLRVPDVPVRPGQLFSATLLLRHNFTASVLTLR